MIVTEQTIVDAKVRARLASLDMTTGTHDMVMFWNGTALSKSASMSDERLLDNSTYRLTGAEVVEDAPPVLRLVANMNLVTKVEACTPMPSYVARAELLPCLMKVAPVSLRGERWLRSFDERR